MTPTNTQGSERETAWVTLARLEDLETTIADASPEELPDLHSKLLALSDGLHAGVLALIKSDREATTVNRFEVINHLSDGSGREVVVWNGEPFKVETSLQDQGQTLKVFLTDVAHLSKEDSNHA